MPADPPRQVPKFDVRRVQKISNPRAQEAYMAELQDTAGLCEGRVTALDMDALKVRSDQRRIPPIATICWGGNFSLRATKT